MTIYFLYFSIIIQLKTYEENYIIKTNIIQHIARKITAAEHLSHIISNIYTSHYVCIGRQLWCLYFNVD